MTKCFVTGCKGQALGDSIGFAYAILVAWHPHLFSRTPCRSFLSPLSSLLNHQPTVTFRVYELARDRGPSVAWQEGANSCITTLGIKNVVLYYVLPDHKEDKDH